MSHLREHLSSPRHLLEDSLRGEASRQIVLAEDCLIELNRRQQGAAREPFRPSLQPIARIPFGHLRLKACSFPLAGSFENRQRNTATAALAPF